MSFLDQSTILITGASSGLGAEFARQLAPRAKCLILAARRADRLAKLAAEIARTGLIVHCITADLADPAQAANLVAQVRELGAKVNVLINNAGLGDHGLFEDSDWGRVERMIEVNVTGLTRMAHAFAKELITNAPGAILNVASIAALLPVPQLTVYAATKTYVLSFSEGLRSELRGTGVNVLALCPGPVDTEFFDIAERPRSDGSQAAPEIMKVPATQVVSEAIRGLERDRPRVIPGRLVSAVMKATCLTPMFIQRIFLNRRGRGYRGH